MSPGSWQAGFAGVAIIATTAYAVAQMPGHQGMTGDHEMRMGQTPPLAEGIPDHHMKGLPGHRMTAMMRGHMMMGNGASGQPTRSGQAAFGTIQEIVQILEADPNTDWSKVDIAALRQHLIDMDEVTLRAIADAHPLDNGIEIAVTGEGRTVEAIKRMVPAHVHELNNLGWNARTDDLANGVRLTVTSTEPRQVMKLKALGFMGIMVQGSHHQLHHLMMAKGEFMH
jgi:hypothetical protein